MTVVHSRVDFLELEDLNHFELGTQDLWDELTKQNTKMRQTFKQGSSKKKLNLIHPEQQEDDREGGAEDLGLGVEDSTDIKEDDEELLLDKTDDDQLHQTEGFQPENEKDIISDPKRRYNLRPRRKAIVNKTETVNKTVMIKNEIEDKMLKNILKCKNYSSNNNFNIKHFKMSDKFHFQANKKALLHHFMTCLVSENCNECLFYKTIKGFAFQKNSLLQYELGYANLGDTKIQPKSQRVIFAEKTKREDSERKELKVNWTNLHLAIFYCVSLSELSHLKF